jgi:hypothetical protein
MKRGEAWWWFVALAIFFAALHLASLWLNYGVGSGPAD